MPKIKFDDVGARTGQRSTYPLFIMTILIFWYDLVKAKILRSEVSSLSEMRHLFQRRVVELSFDYNLVTHYALVTSEVTVEIPSNFLF